MRDLYDDYCLQCDALIEPESIEIEDDPADAVAHCAKCGATTLASKLVRRRRSPATLAKRAPPGCKVVAMPEGVRLSARLFAAKQFFLLALGSVFVTLPVSFFTKAMTGVLYSRFVGPLPDGSPLNEPIKPPNLPELLLLLLLFFGVYLAAKIVGMALLQGFGRIDVVIGKREGWVATGIGPIRWRRRFHTADVRGVKLGNNSHGDELIEIRADRRIRFGMLLGQEQRDWLCAIMKEELRARTA